MVISYIVAPLVGGMIGYITNALAIRMLFRPHEEKHVFGFRIPLTPGVIPKEKDRIAESVGMVISEKLMNPETLEGHLLSPEMLNKLHKSVEVFIEKQQSNTETVAELLGHYLSEEEIKGMAESVNESLTRQIHDKLSDHIIGGKIADVAVNNVLEELSQDGNSFFRSIGKSALATILTILEKEIKQFLAEKINEIFKSKGDEIVSNLINDEADKFLSTPVQQLLQGKEDQLAKVPGKIVSLYTQSIKDNLRRILKSVKIADIVSGRIKGMNVVEAEEIILQVMKKELKAIVWLGAGLGFLMGFVNVLV